MKKVFVFMILVLTMGVAQGQNNDKWLRLADSCLKAGDCGCAQGAYDTYKQVNKGKRDKQMEKRIADCQGVPINNEKNMTIMIGNLELRMVYVEGGTFNMGAQKDYPNDANYNSKASDDEYPIHSVTLDSYYIGETEVTQALWRKVMGRNTSVFSSENGIGNNCPAYGMSYKDVQEFIKRLNEMTGYNFSLPTEAEWEYAARGGKKSHGYLYSGSNNIDDVAWYLKYERRYKETPVQPVKTKQANELGLYDMSGNVNEWCSDWFDYYYYVDSPRNNPKGPGTGNYRVIRGGSSYEYSDYCRVAYRSGCEPSRSSNNIGFRLVLRHVNNLKTREKKQK